MPVSAALALATKICSWTPGRFWASPYPSGLCPSCVGSRQLPQRLFWVSSDPVPLVVPFGTRLVLKCLLTESQTPALGPCLSRHLAPTALWGVTRCDTI